MQERQVSLFRCPTFCTRFLTAACGCVARAGRYDSTERHCNNCPGFAIMRADVKADMYPFAISKGEFDALQKYRKTPTTPGKEVRTPALVEAVVFRFITKATGATRLPEPASPDSQPADGSADAAPAEEQPSPFPSPADPSPSVQPQQPEQPLPAEPIYDVTGDGGAVSQVAPEASWLDPVGTSPPGLFLQPPYELYPANTNTSTLPKEPIYDVTGDGGAVSQVAPEASWLETVGTSPPGLFLQPPYELYPANTNTSTLPNADYDPA